MSHKDRSSEAAGPSACVAVGKKVSATSRMFNHKGAFCPETASKIKLQFSLVPCSYCLVYTVSLSASKIDKQQNYKIINIK